MKFYFSIFFSMALFGIGLNFPSLAAPKSKCNKTLEESYKFFKQHGEKSFREKLKSKADLLKITMWDGQSRMGGMNDQDLAYLCPLTNLKEVKVYNDSNRKTILGPPSWNDCTRHFNFIRQYFIPRIGNQVFGPTSCSKKAHSDQSQV